eukprot:6467722-Amphidinium_carterae.3
MIVSKAQYPPPNAHNSDTTPYIKPVSANSPCHQKQSTSFKTFFGMQTLLTGPLLPPISTSPSSEWLEHH